MTATIQLRAAHHVPLRYTPADLDDDDLDAQRALGILPGR